MKKRNMLRIRVDDNDKETLELASKMSDTPFSEIVRIGAIKEAKKVLRDIERGK